MTQNKDEDDSVDDDDNDNNDMDDNHNNDNGRKINEQYPIRATLFMPFSSLLASP